jgi:signal transduction histidine kinase/ABC-type branched-subunit amino acid transport system ATPase component
VVIVSTIVEGAARAGGGWSAARGGALLDIRSVSKRFGDLQVLDGVSLTVAPGELVALVGDNGAGKTTLVKCIGRAASPDRGEVLVAGEPLGLGQDDVAEAGIAIVWQDLSLCDNLDSVANLFLGRERHQLLLARAEMHAEARRMLTRLDIPVPDLTRPVATLSGGQRQAIAVARALAGDPRLLILDEPTASLGRTETAAVLRLVRRLRAAGTAILLVTHQLEQVFDLADRIDVMRQGQIVATVSPREVHPDDVVALQLGIEVDSTASRQLRRLGSLVEQLSEVEPAASLPLVVSALSAALGQESLCVHLVDERPGGAGPVLRRSAALGVPDPLLEATADLPLGPAGGPIGLAAWAGSPVVTEDVRIDPAWRPFRPAAAEAGVVSSWAAPITGASGVLGTIAGFGDTVGRPRGDQLALIGLYANHAAGSIERERLFAESQRRNRVLETIRTVLEALAGPEHVHSGTEGALAALAGVLAAEGAVIRVAGPEGFVTRAAGGPAGAAARPTRPGDDGVTPRDLLVDTADSVLASATTAEVAGATGHVLAVPFEVPEGRAALAVLWRDAAATEGGAEVLHDAARSLSLGLEREGLEAAHREAQALRRSQRLQREFLSRLSHELRTPLTAIHGCVDTLLQPDVAWGEDEQRRFLDTIGMESSRMRRLVADLLDVSAIEAGIFRIAPDWCDLGLVLQASVACAAPGAEDRVAVAVAPDLGPVWADHDKVEQVVVNLLENALRHAPPGTLVRVAAEPSAGGREAEVVVSDEGEGVAPELVASLFEPHVADPASGGTGLGLAIARGIARAHGGALTLRPGASGATFVLSLPTAPTDAGPAPTPELVEADG